MPRRLKALHYRVVPLTNVVSFTEDAEPVVAVLNGFRCVATATGLTAVPTAELEAEFEFEEEFEAEYVAKARSMLHDALEAWSATSELIDRSPLLFEYQGDSTETIPSEGEGGERVIARTIVDTISLVDVVAVAKNNLPQPHPYLQREGPVAGQNSVHVGAM